MSPTEAAFENLKALKMDDRFESKSNILLYIIASATVGIAVSLSEISNKLTKDTVDRIKT